MRLRSFSLSKVIPVEIIHLIIHESDSVSTLKAWALVSLPCFSVAQPLLNEHVHISRRDGFQRILERIALAENESDERHLLLHHLPRLSSSLSFKNIRQLSITVKPRIEALERFLEENTFAQPSRSSLVVHFLWSLNEQEELIARVIVVPAIVRLLRPGSFTGLELLEHGGVLPCESRLTGLRMVASWVGLILFDSLSLPSSLSSDRITSCPLQAYSTFVSSIPFVRIDTITAHLPIPPFLHLFAEAFQFVLLSQRGRDIARKARKADEAAFLTVDPLILRLGVVCETAWNEFCLGEEIAEEELRREQEERTEERSPAEAEEALRLLRQNLQMRVLKYTGEHLSVTSDPRADAEFYWFAPGCEFRDSTRIVEVDGAGSFFGLLLSSFEDWNFKLMLSFPF
ncbi:hypothetical protein BDY24DRAFT_398328 [Mrakia frigida]|uniref:uncharacterized protein n=1 Tax=Mrakia frigida TaxID=29902 RepID=UPI003FCC03BD